jgi:hypothetical protein
MAKMVPRSPIGIAFLLWRVWRRLPPAQRRQLLEVARRHGPRLAGAAKQRVRPKRA